MSERRECLAVELKESPWGSHQDIPGGIYEHLPGVVDIERESGFLAALCDSSYALRGSQPDRSSAVLHDGANILPCQVFELGSGAHRRLELRALESRETRVRSKPHPAVAVLKYGSNIF